MSQSLRKLIAERAAGRCEYCLLDEEADVFAFHVEHVIPKKHGGTDDSGNLAFACHQCNLHKGPNLSGIDPATETICTLFNPRRQRWGDHFRFDGARIAGLTDVGRATARVLCMNDADRVRVRQLLGYTDRIG